VANRRHHLHRGQLEERLVTLVERTVGADAADDPAVRVSLIGRSQGEHDRRAGSLRTWAERQRRAERGQVFDDAGAAVLGGVAQRPETRRTVCVLGRRIDAPWEAGARDELSVLTVFVEKVEKGE